MKKRQSNFELMRILSMFLIVTGHVFSWGGILEQSDYRVSTMIYLIYAVLLVHVNSFILLTGYFQSKSKFRIKKIIKLLFLMYFYKIVLVFIGYKLGWFNLNNFDLFWNLSPFDFSNYWFLKIYIVLYFLSPFLNKFLNEMPKKIVKKLIIVLFIFCSLLITLTNQEIFNNMKGFSLIHFIMMYIIGFYLRKYIVETSAFKNIILENKKAIINFYLFFATFVLCFILNYTFYRVGYRMSLSRPEIAFFGNRIINVFMAYDNPLVIIGSVAYFMCFASIRIKNRFINFVSSIVFEIYIIHETVLFRKPLYSVFNLKGPFYSYSIIIKGIMIAGTIFLFCMIVAFIRKYLFKLIKLLVERIKFVKNINEKVNLIEYKVDNYFNFD